MALAGPIVTVVVVLLVVALGPLTGTRLSEIVMITIRKQILTDIRCLLLGIQDDLAVETCEVQSPIRQSS